jgi:hypothetical protein
VRSEIAKRLAKQCAYSLETDGWRNVFSTAFMQGVFGESRTIDQKFLQYFVVRFVNENFELETYLLHLSPNVEVHDREFYEIIFAKQITSWKIPKQRIISVTTDADAAQRSVGLSERGFSRLNFKIKKYNNKMLLRHLFTIRT